MDELLIHGFTTGSNSPWRELVLFDGRKMGL